MCRNGFLQFNLREKNVFYFKMKLYCVCVHFLVTLFFEHYSLICQEVPNVYYGILCL